MLFILRLSFQWGSLHDELFPNINQIAPRDDGCLAKGGGIPPANSAAAPLAASLRIYTHVSCGGQARPPLCLAEKRETSPPHLSFLCRPQSPLPPAPCWSACWPMKYDFIGTSSGKMLTSCCCCCAVYLRTHTHTHINTPHTHTHIHSAAARQARKIGAAWPPWWGFVILSTEQHALLPVDGCKTYW